MCKPARPSQQQLSVCDAFAGNCRRRHIALSFSEWLYVVMCVCLSVSRSLNPFNREWTYFNETHHNCLYCLVNMTFSRSPVKGQIRQRQAMKSCELDRFGTAKEISTKTYTNTSCSQATNWLRLQGHGFKGQGHRQYFSQMHFSGESTPS